MFKCYSKFCGQLLYAADLQIEEEMCPTSSMSKK